MRLLSRLNPALVAVLCGVVALALGAYRISRPHVLGGQLGYNLGYDDGVYFGAALRFMHGSAPYRDFVIVHPPAIVYLLAPTALVGRIFTEHDGLVVARILTVLVTAANASLAALVVRGRGRVAMAVAGLALAMWPLSVAVDRTVELEPYLVFFCLLGAVTLFDGEGLATGRRLVWSGIWFGLAMDVKVGAVLPTLAALLVVGWGRRTLRFLIGTAIAIVVVCLPFFVLAPKSFFHDVITAQLTRDE